MALKYDFNRIALMWRPEKGQRRICVGYITIAKNSDDIRFEYLDSGMAEAKKVDSNFSGYPGLSIDDNKQFSSLQVSEVFFGRLINQSRNDADDFYDFWLVDKSRVEDSLYVLSLIHI